ncbi:amidase family protein [Nocardioides sp. W7]|uniref:amidase family protein n=1 Tax=Nocardioides sp. W7 TaxID=2931390 RepID=UPI001FD17C01|nr:amidase family protein [Nocardioides sp. W7]
MSTALAPDGALTLAPTGSGALDGLRVVVKDLFDVADRVTAAGNPTLAAGPPADAHAAAVATVLAAGASVVGKTATDELAMGMFGVNSHFGTPANPAAPDRVPGGSSSGSASAVAAGEADLGIGTDTGGSIRVPAAFCGLVGLRPTHGRIDVAGIRPMAPGFDTVGLLGRTVDPVAAAFAVLADVPASLRMVGHLVLLTDLLERADPGAAAATRAAAERWAGLLGLELVEAPLVTDPLPTELTSVFWPLMSRQLWESNGAWVTGARPVLGEGIEDRIRAAADITDEQVAAAETLRADLRARLGVLLHDAVAVLPTAIAPAPRRDLPHAELLAYRDRNLAFVVPASLTGSPQLSLPTGTVDGAPVGTSLLGLPDDDELLLSLAAEVAP